MLVLARLIELPVSLVRHDPVSEGPLGLASALTLASVPASAQMMTALLFAVATIAFAVGVILGRRILRRKPAPQAIATNPNSLDQIRSSSPANSDEVDLPSGLARALIGFGPPMCLTDPSGRVLVYNSQFEDLTRFRERGLEGSTLSALFPYEGDETVCTPCNPNACGKLVSPGLWLDDDRSIVWLEPFERQTWALSPLRLSVFIDVTDDRRRRQEIENWKTRFTAAFEMNGEGIWDLDYDLKTIYFSPRFKEILGFQDEELPNTSEAWESLIHPDDYNRVIGAMRAHVNGATPVYDVRYKMRTKSGEYIVLHDRGMVVLRDAAGRARRLIGSHRDVSDETETRQKLQALESWLGSAIAALPEGILIQDADGVILAANPRAAEFLGVDEADLVGSTATDVWVSSQGEFGQPLQFPRDPRGVIDSLLGMDGMTILIRGCDQEERYIDVSAALFPLNDTEGRTGLVTTLADATLRRQMEMLVEEQMTRANEAQIELTIRQGELEEANRKLHVQATTDGLTGLMNHKTFIETLEQRFAQCRAEGIPLSVAMIDVDRFKAYNDTFGHPAGDAVLERVAQLLRDGADATHAVSRYGGEEFAILLPGTDIAGATARLEQIRASIASAEWPLRQVTVSVGVAEHRGARRGTEVLGQADSALYRSKNSGRNRVCQYEGEASDRAA